MNRNELIEYWLSEEKRTFKGWDFTSIDKYTIEEELPWEYRDFVIKYIKKDTTLLDMGTGGGEFLLSLNPYPGMTYATEAYLPNFEYSKAKLKEHGIKLRFIEDDSKLPFSDNMFDLVIDRHESYSVSEVSRILKANGIFITQQVGGKNNHEFAVNLTGNEYELDLDFNDEVKKLEESGFEILYKNEYYPKLKFTDIGAFVYFAKIIEWEFIGFSVEKYLDKLFKLHDEVLKNGFIEMIEHRFIIVSKKK